MHKTPKEIEDKAVELYKSFVRPVDIRKQLSITPTVLYNLLKRRGVALLWQVQARANITEFRCTTCSKIKPADDFPNASLKRVFAKKLSWCLDCQNAYHQKWRDTNRGKLKKQRNECRKLLRDSDLQFKIMTNTASNVGTVLKRAVNGRYQKYKIRSCVPDLIGCPITHLISHLESLFKPGMTWENRNISGWNIDHRVPYRQFDLTTEQGLRAWCNWTNLQPLWAKENIRKGNKVLTGALPVVRLEF